MGVGTMNMVGQKLGLVLGAGSARGLAHIGVIQALLEAKIPIDLVVGSSMGAALIALASMICFSVLRGRLSIRLFRVVFGDPGRPNVRFDEHLRAVGG